MEFGADNKSRDFDPVDVVQMRLIAQLSAAGRIDLMLSARAFAIGLIRGRLKRLYPGLSPEALSMKLVEELSRVQD